MKNFTKIVGITAMAAVIGLSFASCADDEKKAANAAGAAQTIGAVADAIGAGNAVEAAKNAVGKVTAAASGGAASIAPASDFEYILTEDGEGVRINKYIGSGGNIIVPDTIEGFPVTESGGGIFNKAAVTSVVLPDSLADYINKNYVMDGMTGLFTYCAQLQTVTFPKGITKIPDHWFADCTALTSITIPDTVTEIGGGVFIRSGITSIVIPEGVTKIGNYAFGTCPNLTSVTLPASIQEITHGAFENCTSLETVNLPSHQFNIYDDVFNGCSKVKITSQKAIRDAGYTGSFN